MVYNANYHQCLDRNTSFGDDFRLSVKEKQSLYLEMMVQLLKNDKSKILMDPSIFAVFYIKKGLMFLLA